MLHRILARFDPRCVTRSLSRSNNVFNPRRCMSSNKTSTISDQFSPDMSLFDTLDNLNGDIPVADSIPAFTPKTTNLSTTTLNNNENNETSLHLETNTVIRDLLNESDNKTIYITNIDPRVHDEMITGLFSIFNGFIDIFIPTHRVFALINFASESDRNIALQAIRKDIGFYNKCLVLEPCNRNPKFKYDPELLKSTVTIRGINPSFTLEMIQKHCEEFGPVVEVSRGTYYSDISVTFSSQETAQKALKIGTLTINDKTMIIIESNEVGNIDKSAIRLVNEHVQSFTSITVQNIPHSWSEKMVESIFSVVGPMTFKYTSSSSITITYENTEFARKINQYNFFSPSALVEHLTILSNNMKLPNVRFFPPLNTDEDIYPLIIQREMPQWEKDIRNFTDLKSDLVCYNASVKNTSQGKIFLFLNNDFKIFNHLYNSTQTHHYINLFGEMPSNMADTRLLMKKLRTFGKIEFLAIMKDDIKGVVRLARAADAQTISGKNMALNCVPVTTHTGQISDYKIQLIANNSGDAQIMANINERTKIEQEIKKKIKDENAKSMQPHAVKPKSGGFFSKTKTNDFNVTAY